jgi:predicted dehydrogenase
MRQIVQNLGSGELELVEVPTPGVPKDHVLVQNRASLISAGTERNLVEFAHANLVQKALREPARVKQVIDKLKTDGVRSTFDAVSSRLDEPLALGYASAGVVIERGPGSMSFAVGQRVVTNGPHAEVVACPKNLVIAIPDGVSFEQACFAPVGAVALNGVRLTQTQLGETVAVYGLGLIGLCATQLLIAAGVRVLGIDLDPARLALAKSFGADVADPGSALELARSLSDGHGVDAVLITASARNDDVLLRSAKLCRQRGRMVLVGAVEPTFDRADFYQRELSLQVACSYGPGRYDPTYESQGVDYPYGHVRWTAGRNMAAFLEQVARGRVHLDPLITARLDHGDAQKAYDLLCNDSAQLGIVLGYPDVPVVKTPVVVRPVSRIPLKRGERDIRVGVIGAGAYALRTLLPALKKIQPQLVSIASATGLRATHAAKRFGFQRSASDYRALIDDADIDALFISTVPYMHPQIATEALAAGKHVFLEKPMAIDRDGIDSVVAESQSSNRVLMVGFNRRYSPHGEKMRDLLPKNGEPIAISATVNAGQVPRDHWLSQREQSGGRVIAEAVHWIEFATFLTGSTVARVEAMALGPSTDYGATLSLSMADGSVASIHYFVNGHRSYPKERIDVFSCGRVLSLDNFRVLKGYGYPGFKRMMLLSQDKGHARQYRVFLDAIRGKADIPPVSYYAHVSEAALLAEAAAALDGGAAVSPMDFDD